ncbi:hypothetical protein AB1Y20_001377 [Prymnesium parvum]|uniref:Subtilisin n=1 Tax=Prymnesium parvum TaxID=97485 RepID=A0AB34K823_PRYPA
MVCRKSGGEWDIFRSSSTSTLTAGSVNPDDYDANTIEAQEVDKGTDSLGPGHWAPEAPGLCGTGVALGAAEAPFGTNNPVPGMALSALWT